jgi:N-acetylglucosamine kinase-like BadF-type ATPase
MIAIADSGSTKTDWALISDPLMIETQTAGFNPMFHDAGFVLSEIKKDNELRTFQYKIEKVFFYGAGCSSPVRNNIIKQALRQFFTSAKEIIIDHDLKGAALAASKGKPSIVCILGTGSNSVFFDGKELHEEVPSLGYVLGDEGSGAWFGKQLLKDLLYKQLPDDLEVQFYSDYRLTKEDVLAKVYREPNPNVYLASFMKFFASNVEHEVIKSILMTGFQEFYNCHIACFKNHREIPVHFVGSVAFHFKDFLAALAKQNGFELGKTIQCPIDDLVAYHLALMTQ